MTLKVKRRAVGRSGVNRDEAFGARLREAMQRANIRPSALATRCEVHPVTVARWRRGELPDDLRFPQLAECLGVSQEWLKTGQEPYLKLEGAGAPSTPAGRLRAMEARLTFLRDSIRAYTRAGRVPPPEVLADWERAAAEALDVTERYLTRGPTNGHHPPPPSDTPD